MHRRPARAPFSFARTARCITSSAPFQFGATDKRKLEVPFDGQIDDVFVLPGNLVKKGQKMLTMKTYDLQLQLNKSNADMQRAEADYLKNVSDGKEADAEMAQHMVDEAHATAQWYQDQIDRGVVRRAV